MRQGLTRVAFELSHEIKFLRVTHQDNNLGTKATKMLCPSDLHGLSPPAPQSTSTTTLASTTMRTVAARAPGTTIHSPTYQNHSTETPSLAAAVPSSVSVPRAPSISPSTPSPATSNHSQHCKEMSSVFFDDMGGSCGSQDGNVWEERSHQS